MEYIHWSKNVKRINQYILSKFYHLELSNFLIILHILLLLIYILIHNLSILFHQLKFYNDSFYHDNILKLKRILKCMISINLLFIQYIQLFLDNIFPQILKGIHLHILSIWLLLKIYSFSLSRCTNHFKA